MIRQLLAISVLTLAVGVSEAQTVVVDARMGGYAYNSPYNRLYSQRSQVTFTGTVTGIQKVVPREGMAEGTTLLVKSKNGGTSVVELGPTWFVDNQVVKIRTGDTVQVTGSKVFVDGRGVILAKLVKRGTGVLALRRPSGLPYWDIAQPAIVLGPDPNVIEVTGTVQGVTNLGNDTNLISGLVLQTANGTVTIDMGPAWFVRQQGFYFNPGTNLTVITGGTYDLTSGNPIPAYWMRYNNGVYQFRDPATGQGVWRIGG